MTRLPRRQVERATTAAAIGTCLYRSCTCAYSQALVLAWPRSHIHRRLSQLAAARAHTTRRHAHGRTRTHTKTHTDAHENTRTHTHTNIIHGRRFAFTFLCFLRRRRRRHSACFSFPCAQLGVPTTYSSSSSDSRR